MHAIKYHLFIDSSVIEVYEALTTQKGLSSWWTSTVEADPIPGSIAEFRFGSKYHNKMYIVKLIKNEYVEWECLDGDKEWIGTRIKFEIEKKGSGTSLDFEHYDWRDSGDFFASCKHQWGIYMRSLKKYCEKHEGDPFTE